MGRSGSEVGERLATDRRGAPAPRTGPARRPGLGRIAAGAVLWVVALLTVNLCLQLVDRLGLGWDARAYWDAWHGPMYGKAPNTVGAYLYSPAFAQAFWPLAHLPWPTACAVCVVAPAVAQAWLLRPLGLFWGVPLWVIGLVETLSGNIFWLLAVVAVVGLRTPAAWALPALTKITPCLGPIWFLVRREWRPLITTTGCTAGVALASYLLAPDLWQQWLAFLGAHASGTTQGVGSAVALPLAARLPVALCLLVWGSLTSRRWTLPVSMMLSVPVVSLACVVVLYAIPRLKAQDRGGA